VIKLNTPRDEQSYTSVTLHVTTIKGGTPEKTRLVFFLFYFFLFQSGAGSPQYLSSTTRWTVQSTLWIT